MIYIESDVNLQPLRIPAYWHVGKNTLFELDPTNENIKAGYFGGSSKFYAINEGSRLVVDVAWTPEDDLDGEYLLIIDYVPWERNEKGKRLKNKKIDYSNSRTVHEFRTTDRMALVKELEKSLSSYSKWIEHS